MKIQVLLLLGLVAIVAANPFLYYDQLNKIKKQQQGVKEIRKWSQYANSAVPNVLSNKRADGTPGPKCLGAITKFNDPSYASCGFGAEGQDINNIDPSTVCKGKCKTALDAVIEACKDDETVGAFIPFFQLICTQDSTGKYCFTVFGEIESLPEEQDTLTEAQLKIICTECFFKVIDALASIFEVFGDTSGSGAKGISQEFDLLCTKVGDKFCVLSLQTAFQDCVSDTDLACIIQNLDVLCEDPCFKKILAKQWLYLDPESEEAKQLQANIAFACVRNTNGYCLPAYIDQSATFHSSGCSEETLNTQGCSDTTCKNALQTFVTGMGCCLKTYIEFSDKSGDGASVQALEDALQPCGITLPASCPRKSGTKKIAKKFIISISWTWAQSHKDALEAVLIQDLSGILGVPVEDIEIISFEEADYNLDSADSKRSINKRSTKKPATLVNFSFQAESDKTSETLSTDFDTSVDEGGVFFPKTSAEYSIDNPNESVHPISASSGERLIVSAFIFTALLILTVI